MNSCEFPHADQSTAASARVSEKGSRIHRFQPGAEPLAPHSWHGVAVQEYKPSAEHHFGVLRSVLVGDYGEQTRFQLRYFEIAPTGFTTLEHHRHEHAVVVLRGRGEVYLNDRWHEVGFGDTVYVAPDEVHQLRNMSATEAFGFLCIVDRERDRPVAG
jgi:quercetin dioxygenase-like cupin family protein